MSLELMVGINNKFGCFSSFVVSYAAKVSEAFIKLCGIY